MTDETLPAAEDQEGDPQQTKFPPYDATPSQRAVLKKKMAAYPELFRQWYEPFEYTERN